MEESQPSQKDFADDDNDFVEDDDGNGYAEPIESRADALGYYEKQLSGRMKRNGRASLSLTSRLVPESHHRGIECQESFQPGATPLKLGKQYLAFNLVGTIYSVVQHDQSTVHITHHDKSHRDYSLPNSANFTIAALGQQGAVFASESSSNGTGVVEYKPFDSWSSGGGWRINMGVSEGAKCVALTRRAVVIGTDSRYLRFLTNTGLQTDVRSLDGNLVSLAGEGDSLLAVYHLGGTYHGDQNLGYILMNTSRTVTTLVCSYDSCGVLRTMSPHDDFTWRPVFDGRIAVADGKQVTFWPVGVTSTQMMCVICKSGDKHPQPPRAIVSDVSLAVPMLGEGPDIDEDERLIRKRLSASHANGLARMPGAPSDAQEGAAKMRSEIDKQMIKRIMAACKEGHSQKAAEMASTLSTLPAIDGAIKVAISFKQSALATKISQFKEASCFRFLFTFLAIEQKASAHKVPRTEASALPTNLEKEIGSIGHSRSTESSTANVEKGHETSEKTVHPGTATPKSKMEAPGNTSDAVASNRSGGKRSSLFGIGLDAIAQHSMAKVKTEKDLPAKPKNPFASLHSPSISREIKISDDPMAEKPASQSVSDMFADLKEFRPKDAKNEKTVAALATATKRKQESLLGFFGKKAKQDGEWAAESAVGTGTGARMGTQRGKENEDGSEPEHELDASDMLETGKGKGKGPAVV
ncbi:hypothetical protein HDU84_001539 [Entophlyctis sp. JEL0112]|nr:hypothetical protein HDU84_001539 [Entophlyctis sp. JEL0112]